MMQGAIFAMDGAHRGGHRSPLAALCVALGLALAGASAAGADDIEAEVSTPEPPEGTVILAILDGGLRYEGTVRDGKMHGSAH